MAPESTSKWLNPKIHVLVIWVVVGLITGASLWTGYHVLKNSISDTITSNRMTASHLAELTLERQRATLGIVKSYAHRPLVIEAVRRKDFQAAVPHLKELDDVAAEIAMAFISDKDGTLWANHPVYKEFQGKNFSQTDWYKGVCREWKPYVSDVFKRTIEEKDLAMVACVPIFDKKDEVIGILGTSQRTLFLAQLARRVKSDLQKEITVLDRAGQVIFSDKLPDPREVTHYQLFSLLEDAFQNGRADTKMKDPYEGGRVKYFSFVPIEELGWSVVVGHGRAEILKSQVLTVVLIGGVWLLLCAGVILGFEFIAHKYRHLTEVHFLSSRILTAQEEEKKRIAADIHDSIGSSLSQIRYKVEATLAKADTEAGPGIREDLKSIIPIIQETMDDCRRMQMDLRPSMLDDLGLLPTLSWFCRRFQSIYTGIRIDQKIDIQEGQVPISQRTLIFRITQEAMNNIAKHSQADAISLSLNSHDGRIELEIKDNGEGFDVEETLARERSRRGLGLESMRERAELSDGSFRIESARGKGTVIRASWPTGL